MNNHVTSLSLLTLLLLVEIDKDEVLVRPVGLPRPLHHLHRRLAHSVLRARIAIQQPTLTLSVSHEKNEMPLVVTLGPRAEGETARLRRRQPRVLLLLRPALRHRGEEVAGALWRLAPQVVGVDEHQAGPPEAHVVHHLVHGAGALLHPYVRAGRRLESVVDALGVLVEDAGVEALVRVAGVHAEGDGGVQEVDVESEIIRCSTISSFIPILLKSK